MPSRFTFDTKHKIVFGREVLAAKWMQAEMLRRAELGAAYAQVTAPRVTEHFAESIKADVYVRVIPGLDTPGPGRAVGRVYSDDPAGAHIELGTESTPAHRTLGGALGVMKAG